MSKNRNITSPLRSGFDYQDLWTLKLIGEWLLNPDEYKWIQIEANPTETQFFLDDIILLDANDKYYLYQAKFKADEQYQWNWDDFLKNRKGKNDNILPSLLNKWATSFTILGNENIKEAALVTNGWFSKEIKKYLSNEKIDIKKLKKEDFNLYKQIKNGIGNEKSVKEFFNKFKFIFENKNIDDIEKKIIKEIFFNSLGATKHGVNNLLSEIRREARKQHTNELTIERLRKWCEFDNPRPLNENFEVPFDFQFFNEATHKGIFQDLQNANGGIKVIYGNPGTGKSVYLSKLSNILKEQEIVNIKHHYHINPSETNSFERLNSNRVIEAIKAQFKTHNYRKYLGDLANKNSRNIPLREFISSVAQNLLKDGKSFVIIIDGLDHVIRESDDKELKNFLKEIFYPQKGLWIVFGMQPQVRNELSLQSIFNKCPEKHWIEIKGLNKKAVFRIIKENILNLNLPQDGRNFNDLKNKLYEINKGNPLHLRYILAQLKNRLKNILVTEYECKNIIPYAANIKEYYTSLWETLDDNTKSFLLTFISVSFQFIYNQFIECISSFNKSITTISQGFKKVEHLIVTDPRSKLRIYHNSFKVFLLDQPEWKQQEKIIKKNVKSWLENSKYENLKWAELRKLEYELGNDKPILEIDREWLIESIANFRNSSQIESQLELCSKAAFGKNNFAKTLKISHLNTYYKNAQDFIKESAGLIAIEAIKANINFIDELILVELPSDVLAIVADIANQYGKFCIIDEIIEILQERLGFQEYRVGEIPLSTEAIIKIIPYDRKHQVKKIHRYIIQFRDLKITSLLFEYYAKKLLSLGQKTKVTHLLKTELNEDEKQAVLGCCVKYDLEQQKSEFKKIVEKNKKNSSLEQIYLILKGNKLSNLPELPDYKDFPLIIKEYGDEREKWAIKFYNLFLVGLIYALSDKQKEIKQWIKPDSPQWSVQATIRLFNSSLKIGKTIQEKNKIDYKDIFNEFNTLSDLKWQEDRERLGFKFALKSALTNIMKDIIIIKHFLNNNILIKENSYKEIVSTPYFLQDDIFELILELEQPILENNIYDKIVRKNLQELKKTIKTFPERSEKYAKLAKLTALYDEQKKSRELLMKAASNLLGYGYHKDVYLFEVLEAIELCAKSGINSKKIEEWTRRIIPLISNVGKYTDGDETYHLPNYLADFFSKFNKHLLFRYHYNQADKEELYPAQDSFKYVIRSLSFSEDVEIALATTALDKDSLNELKEKAKTLAGAKASLKVIEKYLGKINYKDEEYGNSHDFKEKKINYAKVSPHKLEEHLNKLKTKWNIAEYITGWAKYWLDQGNKQGIYNLIKSVTFQKEDLNYVSGELLDILYPLSYEFDNEEAFNFLCHAQINDHGWSSYWTDKKKAEKRWQFIKEKYPKRYLEFFKNSVGTGFPQSRSVEFFIRFDDLSKAIEITEASVEFVEELMVDLNLPNPDWAKNDFYPADEVDLLFQRLVWPSSLVRERAATAIGNLLANSLEKEEIYRRLLKWISNWKVESIIAMGLLSINKAFQVRKKKSDLSFIKIENIISSIQANSIIIEELLKEIASETKEKINRFPQYTILNEMKYSYEANNFFNKYIKMILAPIYFDRAQEIEEKTRKPFIKIWAYNAEILAKKENIELNSDLYFYGRHKNDKFLIGFSTKVSEIYRSAFLRVLHNFYSKKLIPLTFYLKYSFASLPVDLSFWNILPNRVIEWWPKLIGSKNGDKKEKISTIQLKEPIENIIKYNKNNKIVLATEGAIRPTGGWGENLKHSFSLIGFGYKVIGSDFPKPEEVAKEILHSPQTLLLSTKAEDPISFLKNSILFDISSEPIPIKGLVVFPLITRNRDLKINLWQYFRGISQSFNIVNELRADLSISIKYNIFKDWLEGLQERYEFEMPIPHGHYVLIDDDFLIKKLKEYELRLGYILKTTFRDKKYSREEVQKIENYKFLNVSKIIL
jgi:hypothetical protein